MPLASISPSGIQTWLGRMQQDGLSASRIRQAHVVLLSMLDVAVRDSVIARNVARGARLPKLPRHEAAFFDVATINEMITSMHKEGIFEAEIRNQNLQKGRGEAGTEYELFVIYRAPASYPSEHVAEIDKAGKGGDVPR